MKRSRKYLLSVVFLLFFALSLWQPLGGEREDWPFSYFGMYKGLEYDKMLVRFDVDYSEPGNEPKSLFRLTNGFHIIDQLSAILLKQKRDFNNAILKVHEDIHLDESSLAEARRVLAIDGIKLLSQQKVTDQTRLRIRYRFWKKFTYKDRLKPDRDIIVLDLSLKELRQENR